MVACIFIKYLHACDRNVAVAATRKKSSIAIVLYVVAFANILSGN